VRALSSAVLIVAGVAALAVVPATPSMAAKRPPKKTVHVGDDYFSPLKVTVKPGTIVTWKWLSVNGNTHDVKLKKGPKKVKRFHSDAAAADFSYKRTLKVKGKYQIICTFHENMVQTITVR
jgi:plastocyanin